MYHKNGGLFANPSLAACIFIGACQEVPINFTWLSMRFLVYKLATEPMVILSYVADQRSGLQGASFRGNKLDFFLHLTTLTLTFAYPINRVLLNDNFSPADIMEGNLFYKENHYQITFLFLKEIGDLSFYRYFFLNHFHIIIFVQYNN